MKFRPWFTASVVVFLAFKNASSAPAPTISSKPAPKVNGSPAPTTTPVQALRYLADYGFLSEFSERIVGGTNNDLRNSILEYQMYEKLNQTGTLDEPTRARMAKPRCGMRDKNENYEGPSDYLAPGKRWNQIQITYRIDKYSTGRLKKREVDDAIAAAFQKWSDYTPLNFTPMATGPVHIGIRFEKGDHNDDKSFDGADGVLAHAYYPNRGDTHFDDEENWTLGDNNIDNGFDLVKVATHEFGHSLGLDHSNEPNSVMDPHYSFEGEFGLGDDDILAVQGLYGKKTEIPLSRTALIIDPGLCENPSIDTAFTTSDGSAYIFQGDRYWKLADYTVAFGYPQPISSYWRGLPSKIDAAFTNPANNKTYFFKGSSFWRYTEGNLDKGYPKPISKGFPGVPNNVDLVFKWSKDNLTYFFKGGEYWRYVLGENISKSYPKSIFSDWKGLPDNLNAAMTYKLEGKVQTYFFKKDQYYRYDDKENQVQATYPSFPRPTKLWFFGCPHPE